jgi:NADPH:quinone reductase-like Zn-dependent oxidoreductase
MKALRFSEFGDPLEVLRLEEVDVPDPRPGEVRLRMAARPVNAADLLTIRGRYAWLPQLPATPGQEGVGRIDAVGEGVSRLKVGQRVIPMSVSGTWQEMVLASASQLMPAPDEVPDAVAAQFLVHPLTAWLLLEQVPVPPGAWVLQTAAASALGRMLVQMARLKGLRTINVVRRREQVAELHALGADEVVDVSHEDLRNRVKAVTGGEGVAVAFEAVGGELGARALRTLAPGGTMIAYGIRSMEPLTVQGAHLVFRGVTVRGFWLSSWFQTSTAASRARVFGEVMSLLAQGLVDAAVEAQFEIPDFAAAIRRAEAPGRRGKVLLVG